MHKKIVLVFTGVIIAALLAACSASPDPQNDSPPASEPQQTEVKIVNFTFEPQTVTVKTGTTLQWSNEDGAAHTTTSDAGDWDSGSLSTGSTFRFTFNQAGTFTYHCEIHPGMTGTIEVTQ